MRDGDNRIAGNPGRGNLRPAPFALTPAKVRVIVREEVRSALADMIEVSVLPVKLVDRPRRSEDPRLARANDNGGPIRGKQGTVTIDECGWPEPVLTPAAVGGALGIVADHFGAAADSIDEGLAAAWADYAAAESCPADWPDAPLPIDELLPPPGETIRSGEDGARGAVSGNLPVPEAVPHPIPSEPALGSRPGDGVEAPRRGNPLAVHLSTGGEPGAKGHDTPLSAPRLRAVSEVARKADVMFRQRRDREARALERPVDAVTGDRRELIRVAARKIEARKAAAARLSIGERCAAPVAIPANPAEARRERIERAIAFLKTRGLIVQVIDRRALVREYRITGSNHRYMAEGVIERAVREGFDA